MRTCTRKHFSGSFKAKVALEATRAVKTVNEIAQEYGIHPTQVGQWKKELDWLKKSLGYASNRADRLAGPS